jgi:hypothetical protein
MVDEGEETLAEQAKRLVETAMPERQKQTKNKDETKEMKGGAEVFIPGKKRRARKIRYPKDFDPLNPPAHGPDPERWLPKWQRSRFKKLAKKRGIYLRGA